MGTQTDWNTAPYPFGLNALCGCKGTLNTGQELFRVLNYARTVAGLPTTTDWPGFSPIPVTNLLRIVNYVAPSINAPNSIAEGFGIPSAQWLLFQIGQGLSNPMLYMPAPAGTFTFTPATPGYSFIRAQPNGSHLTYCLFDSNFVPYGVFGADFYTMNHP